MEVCGLYRSVRPATEYGERQSSRVHHCVHATCHTFTPRDRFLEAETKLGGSAKPKFLDGSVGVKATTRPTIRRVSLFGIRIPQVVFFERDRRTPGIRADRAEAHELLHSDSAGVLHQLYPHDRTVVEEPSRPGFSRFAPIPPTTAAKWIVMFGRLVNRTRSIVLSCRRSSSWLRGT